MRSALRLLALALAAQLFTSCVGLQGTGDFDTVIIDAGHGAHDSGARPVSGKYEKDLALDTAKRLRNALRWRGFKVIMTRDTDRFIPLGGRTAISNRTRNSIFVSVHYNHAPWRSAQGIETFYYSDRSERLASNVQKELLKAYRTKDRGVKQRGFFVLRKNNRPAILVECGFLSSPHDNAAAQSASTRQRIADAIARGIANERKGKRP
jgi:N-acetylmuramoyl-L-alanine amidase